MSETKGDYYPRMNALLQEEEIQRLQVKVNMLEAENVELKEKLAKYEEGFPMDTAPRDGTEILAEVQSGSESPYLDIVSWDVEFTENWIGRATTYFEHVPETYALRWWPLPGGAK